MLILELDAQDKDRRCSLYWTQLKPLEQYASLVANYVGGNEDYSSYAGRIRVKGDLEKEFTNILFYGTNLGSMGVIKGC